MAKLKVQQSGCPQGRYKAKFSGVENSTHEEYGERLRWVFEITEGPLSGQETSCFTGAVPKGGAMPTHCYTMLCNLSDKKLEFDDEFDPDTAIGVEYDIDVVTTPSGNGTKVDVTRVRMVTGQDVPF